MKPATVNVGLSARADGDVVEHQVGGLELPLRVDVRRAAVCFRLGRGVRET